MKIKTKWNQYDVLQHVYENVHSVRIDPTQGTIHLFNKVNHLIDDGPLAETTNIDIEDENENASNVEEVVKLKKIAETESERALHYRTMWQQAIRSNHQLRVDELTREVAALKLQLENDRLNSQAVLEKKNLEYDDLLLINGLLRKKIYRANEMIEDLRQLSFTLAKEYSELKGQSEVKKG